MKSEGDYLLTSRTHFVNLEVVAYAFFVKKVAARQICAHHPRVEFLIARQTSYLQNSYIYCSPPSNSIVTRELMAYYGSPLYF